jgi:hypothetical protein
LGTINHAKELEAEAEKVETVRGQQEAGTNTLEKKATQLEAQLANQHGANERPWTRWEELRIWRRVKSEDNLFKITLRPFPMLFPQVLHAFLTYGSSTSWLMCSDLLLL